MKAGISITELAEQISANKAMKSDLIADTRQLSITNTSPGRASLFVEEFGHSPILGFAHGQISDRVGIPKKYYDRMLNDAPDLLASNINRWFQNEPQRRMIRMLGGDTRAFLSDRYQRIENEEIAEVALPILHEIPECQVLSCQITERKMYIKALAPRIEGEVGLGDRVQAGIVIENSEVGAGAVRVRPLVYRLICLNGMILPDSGFRAHHIGARADVSEDVYKLLSDETKEADDRAILLKVRDVVKAAVDQTNFDEQVARMQETTERSIKGDPVKAVEVLAKKLDLHKGEQSSVLRHLIEGGDLSQWGALNAVTRTAEDIEDYDRATEFEVAGGKVLDLAPREWREIAEAA